MMTMTPMMTLIIMLSLSADYSDDANVEIANKSGQRNPR